MVILVQLCTGDSAMAVGPDVAMLLNKPIAVASQVKQGRVSDNQLRSYLTATQRPCANAVGSKPVTFFPYIIYI